MYGKDTCPKSDPSWWDCGQDVEFRNGRMGGELSHSIDVIDACTCTPPINCCGYVVDGNAAMTTF